MGSGQMQKTVPIKSKVKKVRATQKNMENKNGIITHLGSGSSRIAAYKGGFDFVGFEIDKEYYEAQERRFNIFKAQTRLF